MGARLRMLENSKSKLETLNRLLREGEDSGISDYNYEAFIAEMDENINQKIEALCPES